MCEVSPKTLTCEVELSRVFLNTYGRTYLAKFLFVMWHYKCKNFKLPITVRNRNSGCLVLVASGQYFVEMCRYGNTTSIVGPSEVKENA